MAMRILPPQQRNAMFEIYAFCRAVDDIADDPGERALRLAQLQQWRRDIDTLYGGTPPARLRGLAQAVAQFGLERADFLAVIDGMEMDVLADIRAAPRTVASSPTISGVRFSSPIFCATSTRMRRSAGSICRVRRSTRPGLRRASRARCCRMPRSAAPARRWWRARASISSAPTPS
jgi:hypothetical protein